jgi:hypothetical protein
MVLYIVIILFLSKLVKDVNIKRIRSLIMFFGALLLLLGISNCGSSGGDKASIATLPIPELHEFSCKKADFNSDKKINVTDITFLKNSFNSKTGDENYVSNYDLNSDGFIDNLELVLIGCCLNQNTELIIIEEFCIMEAADRK